MLTCLRLAIGVAAAEVAAVMGAVMGVVAAAAAFSIVGEAAATDGADAVEADGVDAAEAAGAEDTPGADAVEEDIGPVATATPDMDTLNPTIETAIHAMGMNGSVHRAPAEIVTMEIVIATRQKLAMDLRTKRVVWTLRPRSS